MGRRAKGRRAPRKQKSKSLVPDFTEDAQILIAANVRSPRGMPNQSTMPSMKTLIFAGSTRQNSFNRKLAHAAAAQATQSGADDTLLELASLNIPLYNADLEAEGTPSDVIKLKEIMDSHPAWIIVSPEYNGSYTGLLKNTIDWASSPVKGHALWSDSNKPFSGKVIGLMSASPGALGGLRSLSHLQPVLLNLQAWVCPRQFALSHAGDAFDAEGELTKDGSRKQVQGVTDQVLWAAQRFSG